MTYLAPVVGDSIQINTYNRWEQAFQIYSNIITAQFPEKASELLQYNHTIHMVSTTYVWENIYAYNREFRHHISRHPERSWSIILQQAWTMLLKDRQRSDGSNSFFQKGGFGSGGHQNKKDREPCRHFNKGHCTYGLSCPYDHRCSVKKCRKFGHGVHICHL